MLKDFSKLITSLNNEKLYLKKNQILQKDIDVKNFLNSNPDVNLKIKKFPSKYKHVLYSLMALNQAENILCNIKNVKNPEMFLLNFCKTLLEIDQFYLPIGGLIGYHLTFLKLLKQKKEKQNTNFYEPFFFDLTKKNKKVDEYIKIGLKNLNKIAFICPMGGAGDRLNLYDKKSKQPLPAAKLHFQGKTLVENLIQDIEALEYLYYKTYKKVITSPIVIMTSDEKNNHEHILEIFETNNYFQRNKKNFFFIKQISAPLINENGNWVLSDPLQLALKPSGHGVIWHLMRKTKAFDFLKKLKKEKAIIRQINNPIAGTDYFLLSFIGLAIKHNKLFGFASCPRMPGFKEGVNVLKEKIHENGFFYNFSNIEYTDFEKYNLKNSSSSALKYPANTNILFADLKEIEKSSLINPFPELTINLKTKVLSNSGNDKPKEKQAGRLESMMQNIADSITDHKKRKIKKNNLKSLKTFICMMDRNKIISTTKNQYKKNILETPQKCFYDLLNNYHYLLKNNCKMKLPPMPSIEDFLKKGPAFLLYFNPIIGPLWSIISKKIKNGSLSEGSDLTLEIAEVFLKNLQLEGSLIIKTNLIKNNNNKKSYNNSTCILNNVKIKNLGINQKANNIYWQNKIKRLESFIIILGENSHFHANNVKFLNNHKIIVPPFHKMLVFKKNEKTIYKLKKN